MSTSMCVRRRVCIGSCFWVCWVCAQVRMGLGASGQSCGPGGVCVLPETAVNVLTQNRWIRPGPPLGGGRAGGRASRTGVSSSWNRFLVLSLPHTSQPGTWQRGGGHGSFGVELPQVAGPRGQKAIT